MMAGTEFLDDLDLRPLKLANAGPLEPIGLALGPGSGGLEVAVTRAGRKPGQDTMRSAWKARHGGRAARCCSWPSMGNMPHCAGLGASRRRCLPT